jgi:hypothetical protein
MAKIKHAREIADLPKPYHTAVMAEVQRQTDRGAAIVGAAYVDLVVREALTAKMSDARYYFNTVRKLRAVARLRCTHSSSFGAWRLRPKGV